MIQQFDSSLIATDAEMDAHCDGSPQCALCSENMSDNDVEVEKEMGDDLCAECRFIREEGHEL